MPAGHKVTATNIDAILDQIDSLTDPGWTSYTPSWTGSGGNPAIGNGTLTGRYRRSSGGDHVFFTIRILMGSTTTYGSGVWRVTYPSSPGPTASSILDMACHGYAHDANTGGTHPVITRCESTYLVMGTAQGPGSVLTPTVPFTWTTSDVLTINGWYETA